MSISKPLNPEQQEAFDALNDAAQHAFAISLELSGNRENETLKSAYERAKAIEAAACERLELALNHRALH